MIYISLTKCIVSLLFMSWAWAFPLVSPKEHQISASDGLTAASKPTIIPLIEAYETPTSTVAVTSTPTVTPLFLPVTSSPPDDLGISQVSGFYGPGAWSAWFLTIVASWWRIFRRSEEKFDPNTWFFLLGTNWAALDIFRGIHSLRAISSSVDPAEYMAEYKSKMGLLGAAFNVVFWGTFHIVWQFLPTMYIFQDNDAHKPRLRTLTAGLIFPLLALAASIPLSDIHDLPALYWNGMDSDTHDLVFGMAAGTLVLTIPAIAMGWGLILPGRLVTAIHRLMTSSVTRLIVLLNCLVTISFAPSIATGNAYYWIVVTSVVCYVTPVRWVLPLFWIGVILGATIVYVVKGYLLRSTRAGESCFLMPCAPQSIREADQMYALFAGLFVFIGCEVMPPVVTKFKEWYKERERFVRQTRLRLEQFEMRRRVANVAGTLSNTQSSPTPGRDIP